MNSKYKNLKELLGTKYSSKQAPYVSPPEIKQTSRPTIKNNSTKQTQRDNSRERNSHNNIQATPVHEDITQFSRVINYFQHRKPSVVGKQIVKPQGSNASNNSIVSQTPTSQPQRVTVNLRNLSSFLDNSINDSIQRTKKPTEKTTAKSTTRTNQPIPPQNIPKASIDMRRSNNNSNHKSNINNISSINNSNINNSNINNISNINNDSAPGSRNASRNGSRGTSRNESRNDSRIGSQSNFNSLKANQPVVNQTKLMMGVPSTINYAKRQRDRGDVSLQFNMDASQRQEQIGFVSEEVAKLVGNVSSKIKPREQKPIVVVQKQGKDNFFQVMQHQYFKPQQSPQFRGNLELLQLIKQQEQQERGNSIYEDNSDNDEVLLVDDYHGVVKQNFVFSFVIGRGGFGKVWKVELKKNRQLYAMKEMSKSKVIAKRSVNSVMNEKQLLAELRHPFLVNMSYAFQDRLNLYLVMDLLSGGDLRFHIGRMRKFKENQIKFFVSCIVLGLEYMHNNSVIHRDIKPENLVLDQRGYVRVTDLGIARKIRSDNSSDTSGTPGYMAPEVLYRQNHGIAVDYFALGVIAYEFMLGRRPYNGRSRKEIRDMILSKQVQVRFDEAPKGWSVEGIDFINRLIQRKPQNRLGYNGPLEVKSHPWLKGVPWDKLENKQVEPPYVPTLFEENGDQAQMTEDVESQDELIKQNAILLRKNSVQNLFTGYSYDGSTSVQKQTYQTKTTTSTHSNNVLSQIDTNQQQKNKYF